METFNENIKRIFSEIPLPAYMISFSSNDINVNNVARALDAKTSVWTPVEELALRGCALDPEKIKLLSLGESLLISLILRRLNTKEVDPRAGSRWGLVSVWKGGSGAILCVVVRNFFLGSSPDSRKHLKPPEKEPGKDDVGSMYGLTDGELEAIQPA
ncbi:hypothetical protein TWF481_001923 [Arthrobotrys musiformis]|uniref:Uncharacterized protein n=1 Tax=Arthrobotrys musiformis TaxID=47236 RepID=A0AAV9VXI6_9PEZI